MGMQKRKIKGMRECTEDSSLDICIRSIKKEEEEEDE